ncbi:protoporphyrinogen oxidase [Neptunitalea chrysea]|uniref:Protoporphyrinogen IX dehydrogenase [quinone] n=1 Tax=Neptunitalea chrysea TaxID=1647581 RepID=A0A9W6B4Q7_9FLAO|nr:menaquinone-dependent protoporphyrinogen IX dehydrogenase [Neptunitalea chrysea]GLB51282.1 protoporphyrinogen oxidase [Neptunitalea chrysea]
MKKIAIIYASVDGQTLKISKRISAQLRSKDYVVDMTEITNCNYRLSDYELVVIGASIRYGKHAKKVNRFIIENQSFLKTIKTAFFSVNLVARKSNKNTFDSNPYVQKFIQNIGWKPTIIDVFAGKLDYDSYPFYDKMLIKIIMKITKGPTKTNGPLEYTDWNRVDDFIKRLEVLLVDSRTSILSYL